MAIYKCKMCGGDLEVASGVTVMECEYCGTKQTLPKANEDVVQNLFNRANALRLKCEFDKAEQIYEKILQENDAESEAHWGIVLCKYGIEYVEDPKTYKRIPTCHRTSYDAVTTDADYLAAIEHADAMQRSVYEAEAKAIDEIQKNILSIVKDEKPFDVFICYKETDENGKRTIDSTIANDIYYQLTQEGLKVFYAAITLEDKLGQEYEPYIFAALNSSKVMLVIGTKPQYFTAVWVKNEWSRFLKLMKSDRSKLLIPCYKDMDAYELPEEFAHLQAQDMSKIGFINDVVRGIRKVAVKDEPQPTVVKETVVAAGNANTAPLLKRAFMFLEDSDWDRADDFCEQVLNIDPECAEAYLGKLMAELRVKKQESLQDQAKPFDGVGNYQKAFRFANDKLKTALAGYIEHINTRNENARLEGIYNRASNAMSEATTERAYKEAAKLFGEIPDYKDAAELKSLCLQEAEAVRLERERKAELARKEAERKAKRNKKIALISAAVACAIVAFVIVLITVIIPNNKYEDAMALIDAGEYTKAAATLRELGNYKDAESKARYAWAEAAKQTTISTGYYHTVGLKADGTVVAVGANGSGQCNVADWTDIVAISAGSEHTVGLKADGTVVAVGANAIGQCNVASWTDIVAISAGGQHTVGLKADGTVVAVGYNDDGRCNVTDWTDIVAISAGSFHTVGLKADGTVVAVGSKSFGQCDVSELTDIVAISAGNDHTVGLKADGTVVVVGFNGSGQCNVTEWTDIVAISAGRYHTVGLKADGTVVAVGYYYDGQCDVSDWTDIVAISASWGHTVGLKADGTVIAVGYNDDGQCDVSGWTNIKTN